MMWKAPRKVLMERLRITWLNLIRARTLALATVGQDLPMWNFDQSPFHMNEAGSKAARSLCVRGQAAVTIKEGHSATRVRVSANTMTTSDVSQFDGGIPPLEVMFRVESSGRHLFPRLRSCPVTEPGSLDDGGEEPFWFLQRRRQLAVPRDCVAIGDFRNAVERVAGVRVQSPDD